MSEQTPNSPENMQGASMPEGEPSMEDILASIRKIISDDEPVALESPEDVSAVLQSDAELASVSDDADLMSVLGEPIEVDTVAEAPSQDMVDLDIESVLAEMEDTPIPEIDPIIESLEIEPVEIETVESISADTDDDVFDLLSMDIPMEPDASIETATAIGASAASFTPLGNTDIPEVSVLDLPEVEMPEIELSDEDEMDAVLDDILEMSGEDDVADLSPASVSTDPDLELVKSLMADLADDVGSDPDSHEELDALLAIPEIEPEIDVAEFEAQDVAEDTGVDPFETTELETFELEASDLKAPEPEEDILGDILDMTLEDELESHPDDLMLSDYEPEEITPDSVAADELINFEANNVDEIEPIEVEQDLPSLSEIAAAAEADAVVAESSPLAATLGLAAAGTGFAALGAAATLRDEPVNADTDILAEIDAAIDDQPEPPQTLTDQISEPAPMTQEPSMPVQAVNTDTILDDVTESAAAGAFAQLNTVVEEKAVFNERGPRIGDLVQEALRPMLKDWLDANLKGIVERAVAKEVKRISSGK